MATGWHNRVRMVTKWMIGHRTKHRTWGGPGSSVWAGFESSPGPFAVARAAVLLNKSMFLDDDDDDDGMFCVSFFLSVCNRIYS